MRRTAGAHVWCAETSWIARGQRGALCGEDRESCKSRDGAGGILAIQTSVSLFDDFAAMASDSTLRHGLKGCGVDDQ